MVMKWTHSVLQEDSFVGECRAIEQARSLAFELGVYDGVHGPPLDEVHPVESRPCRSVKRLGFHPFTEVFIGTENDLTMYSISILESCLGYGQMPWAAGLLRGGEYSAIPRTEDDLASSPSAILLPEHIMPGLLEPTHALPRSTPRQMKPNRQEDPPLMDPPDSSEDERPPGRQRDPRRPPLRHFPIWVTQLWDLLQAEGAVEMEEEGPVLYLQSYYISHRNVPHQHISRPLRRDFRFVWEDFEDATAPMDFHLVQPALPLPVTRGVAATVLLTQHPVPRQVACVVAAMYDDIPAPRRVESAHSFAQFTSPRDLLWHAGALRACDELQQQGYGYCTIKVGPFEFDQNRPMRLADGLGIIVRIPPRLTDQEWEDLFFSRFRAEPAPVLQFPDDDAVNLMARSSARTSAMSSTSSSSSTDRSKTSISSAHSIPEDEETWCLAMVYTIDGQEVQVDVPWRDDLLRAQKIAQAFSISREQVTQIHYVASTPQDLAQDELECFLLQREQDAPSSALLRVVLVDIEYRPDHRGAALRIVRRGFWLPHQATAQSIIRLLGWEGHCAPTYNRCALWQNHHVIDIEANHLLHLASGDYIRFHLPWSPDDDIEYLFGSDCEQEPTEHTSLLQMQDGITTANGYRPTGAPTQNCIFQQRSIHERRHPRDLLPPDLQAQLQNLWNRPQLRQRFPDRSEVMLFDTWFLSSRGFHRCGFSRLAALPADTRTWIRRLKQVWSDRADATRAATIALVQPGPSDQRHEGHLLLLQDTLPTHAGCLFSGSGQGILHNQQIRFAALFEQPMTLESFLVQTDLGYLCGQPGVLCRLAWAGFRLQPGYSAQILSGTHLQLTVDTISLDSSNDNHSVVTMLLQLSHERLAGEQVAHTHRPWVQRTQSFQCKLPDDGVASDRVYTTDQPQNQPPPVHPDGFIELRFGDVNTCLTELRSLWEQRANSSRPPPTYHILVCGHGALAKMPRIPRCTAY